MIKDFSALLFASVVFYSPFVPAQSSGSPALPVCASANSDSDGDGYGWENEQSCIVAGSVAAVGQCEDRGDFPWGWNPVTLSSCLLGVQTEPTACVDADGDGWGWNGLATCIVGSGQCEDRGGYPWGWNPVTLTSCRLDETVQPPLPTECTDSDGDGLAALNILDESGSTSGDGAVAIDGITYLTSSTPDTGSELAAYNPATGELTILGDIFPGPVSSGPAEFTVVDGKLYFAARDLMTQRDFWVYDPATGEAPLPLRLFPERTQSFTPPNELTALDDKIYFVSDEFGVGLELAMYDPQTGTVGPVADILEGEFGSNPESLTVVQDKLYFSASDGINGRELWSYDPSTNTSTIETDLSSNISGSSPGTLYVIDELIYYNTFSGGQTRVFDPQSDEPPALIEYTVDGQRTTGAIIGAAAGQLIVQFADEARGDEPWAYDPQTGTTTLMADINPGPEGSRAFNFVGLNGEIYFRAENSFGDFKLWVYNTADQQLRRFIEPGLGFPSELAVVDDRFYFTSGSIGPEDRNTWVYDSRCD